MMEILSSFESLMIRARYHTVQIEGIKSPNTSEPCPDSMTLSWSTERRAEQHWSPGQWSAAAVHLVRNERGYTSLTSLSFAVMFESLLEAMRRIHTDFLV
ncbi:hypothetical protein E2C01_084962 [Portunus trituberculatus]|uniref:Uncharacterized protein n=1 Tax=Portunus trituberculatus TaxID=210409 RepID=A0A5B7J7M2_PORTR|nr:hypothetical protein [Portunus trituberculatus]